MILRIFDERAKTKEAKLQVEIARDQYLLPRLVGMQEHMSHQQGGSGFRGSGEKQIELDRRIIARKLARSRNELAEIVKQRQVQRQRRKNNQIPVIALVGYTNSGKSTLLNTLCPDKQKKVFEKDMLFATLETSTRHIKIKIMIVYLQILLVLLKDYLIINSSFSFHFRRSKRSRSFITCCRYKF